LGLFAKDGFPGSINSLNDAKRYRVGGMTYDARVEYLRSKGVTYIFEVAEDTQNPLKLTLDPRDPGKIDLWITSVESAKQVADKAKVKDIKLMYVVKKIDGWLACNPTVSKDTVTKLSKVLDDMKRDGGWKKINEKYEKLYLH
jgi:polar amino acid transport system substrate-binding protein